MRRVFVAVTLCTAILCLAAPVAQAGPLAHAGDGHHEARTGDARSQSTQALAGKARFAPLGARLAGAATVYGHLVDSGGSPAANAIVECDSWVGAEQAWYWTQDADRQRRLLQSG